MSERTWLYTILERVWSCIISERVSWYLEIEIMRWCIMLKIVWSFTIESFKRVWSCNMLKKSVAVYYVKKRK